MPTTLAARVPNRPARRLSRAGLARIVEGAATFAERLGPDFVPAPGADPAVARARLERWRQLVARGDAERFARRLAWDGLDEAAALRGLGEVRLGGGARLPAWAALLAEASALALSPEALQADPLLDATDARIPFREVALPFVAAARTRLGAASPHGALLAPAAHLQMEAALLRRLCNHAERAVHAFHVDTRGAADGGAEESVRAVLADGMAALFARYPVLARIMAESTLDWVSATAELLARLAADRDELARAFGRGSDPGAVADARAGLSDPHDGGRTVSILRFEDGTAVVYKPRPLGAERAFAAVAEWLNGATDGPELRPLAVLDRGVYGWTAYAARADCDDADAVERFHERAGKLLCLAYLLGGEDLHDENVMACGEHPVLIDLEVLLRPATRNEGIGDTSGMPFWEGTQHSVLAAGLLPRLYPRPDGTLFVAGGLVESGLGGAGANLPSVDGVPAAGDPAAAVERGFRRAFRALLAGRDALLAPDGPLAALGGNRVRVILRNTSVYASLLQRTLTPRFLESGAERSVEADVLLRPALRFPERHRLWPAFRDEARQVERMDVPVFHVRAGGTALPTAFGEIPGYADAPGLERAREKLVSLDEAEMDRQAHCIRITYTSHRLRRGWSGRHAAAAAGGPVAGALGAAREVAGWLEALEIRGADGAPGWMALGEGRLEEVGAGLGHGRAGIGLFLAALAAVGGDAEHRRRAMETLAPVAAAVRDPAARARLAAECGIGAAKGLGGIAWALLRAGRLLDDAALRESAVHAAAALTPAALRADRELDVFGGAAGALLALLALHGETGDADLLARADLCGRRLHAAREADAVSGLRAWRRLSDGELGTGFAHGASGIAHALLRLHRATGRAAPRDAAAEAFAFEAALQRPGAGDWLDHAGQRATPPLFEPICAWCHGAAGIGLARAAAVDALGLAAVGAELERALAAAERAKPSGPSTLCCGAMGRADLFLCAAGALGRPELAERARALGGETAERAARRGTYGAGTLDCAFIPGLFQGMAGIGYQLLRLHFPERIPSVLLLE
ncbi:MAG TPA: type 2 lanthipeptide synthetase LanM family protein [Longimicrobium sp.]|nr:type 2 lanthipeptide synthetase LanM family protein [Longimicrobium sp.]